MRRCANCQFENGSDATACARCGQALGRDGNVATATRGEMPAWLSSLQAGVASAEDTEKAGSASAAGAVAAAAALPIQVRRSRVPVLSLDAGRISGADRPASTVASDAAPPTAAMSAGPASAAALPLPANRSRQRLLLLLLIIVAIITVVVLRHALP